MSFESMVLFRVSQLRRRHRYAGVRKLQKMLADPAYGLPLKIGRDRLLKLLREHDQLSELRKRCKHASTGNSTFPDHPNLLSEIQVSRINQVWVSDITYVRLAGGKFCYLFLVRDYYSRKILGFALTATLSAAGALAALIMAIKTAKPEPGLIHHSDHGIQYCCKEYTDLLAKFNFKVSLTSEQHCYDNAVAERINGILKQEFGLGSLLPNLETALKLLNDGIKIYNNERLHASLGYKTPDYVYNMAQEISDFPAKNFTPKTVNL